LRDDWDFWLLVGLVILVGGFLIGLVILLGGFLALAQLMT
jgi:hypothetical protein